MLNRSASLAMSTSVLEALPGKLDIKRHSRSILYISTSLAMSTSVLKDLPGKLDIKRHSPSILYTNAVLSLDSGFTVKWDHGNSAGIHRNIKYGGRIGGRLDLE